MHDKVIYGQYKIYISSAYSVTFRLDNVFPPHCLGFGSDTECSKITLLYVFIHIFSSIFVSTRTHAKSALMLIHVSDMVISIYNFMFAMGIRMAVFVCVCARCSVGEYNIFHNFSNRYINIYMTTIRPFYLNWCRFIGIPTLYERYTQSCDANWNDRIKDVS